jgi:predicted dehydrogenase
LNGVLEYPEGFAVNLSSTFNNQSAGETGIQFLGTKGTLTIGNGLSFTPENAFDDNRWIVESWPRPLEDAYFKKLKDPRPIGVTLAGDRYREEGPDSTVLHLQHFIDSIHTRKPYWEDASAGHHAAACAHMVNMSAQERRIVEWDYNKDDVKS